jgi:hypothetical protein
VLERYAKHAVAPAPALILYVGEVAGRVAKDLFEREPTLQEEAKKTADGLSEPAQPVLVVLDDVDRRQPDQLLAIFRAVRVLGRLPDETTTGGTVIARRAD